MSGPKFKSAFKCHYPGFSEQPFEHCFEGTKNLCYNNKSLTYADYQTEANKYYGNYTHDPSYYGNYPFLGNLYFKPPCGIKNHDKISKIDIKNKSRLIDRGGLEIHY